MFEIKEDDRQSPASDPDAQNQKGRQRRECIVGATLFDQCVGIDEAGRNSGLFVGPFDFFRLGLRDTSVSDS